MLSRLFRRKPKLTDADASRRREAVLALDASEEATFLGVARDDPDPAVRATAIARITSPETLGAMLDEPTPPGRGDQVAAIADRLAELGSDHAFAGHPEVLVARFRKQPHGPPLAATATRSGEARFATWEEIDLEARTWTVPAERSKTSREHVVPLSSAALGALEVARLYSGGSGPVFASRTGKPLSNGAMSKLTRPYGYTPHGLRASFRSWAAETGVPREVAEAALAHSAGALERAYQRSDLLAARREVMEAWSRHIS